jgi:hypothetical protein
MMSRTTATARWLLAILTLAAGGPISCGVPTQSSAPGDANGGSLSLRLSSGGVTLSSVDYVIVGPNGFNKTGSIDVQASSSLAALIGGIPSGSGYTITLSATSVDGQATCGGSAGFDVSAGVTTNVSVALDCHVAATTGSVSVQGSLNVCPVVDSVDANATNVFLGAVVALSGSAHDSDAGPQSLALSWSATQGRLSATSGPTTTFTCSAPGDAVISFGASDGDTSCNESQSVTIHCSVDASTTFYTTKTPYEPQQDPATYTPPPAGYDVLYTEIVARHGARGLSSVKYDAAAYNMWKQAQTDGALTPLGATLGPAITAIMKANALLGFGVSGITNPGYGNLTELGIGEQQALAARLLTRLSGYFAGVAATAGTSTPRSVLVVSSGVDRAVDSAAFFSGSLASHAPALAPLITQPPAPVGYPQNAPVVQPAGTNRFLLYFHKLVAKTDLVTNTSDPYYQTYQDSLAYQAYLASDPDMTAKVNAVLATPDAVSAARAVLLTLFTADFVNKIDNQTYTFTNAGTFSFTSDDGQYSATVTGDGKTTVKSLTDAASMLYNLYVVAPAMQAEAGVDFTPFIPADQARELAYLQDATDFYQAGPGIQEANPATYEMATALLDDFFSEASSIEHGDLSHGAKLRFTHAEIIMPFASLLGLSGVFVPVPKAQTYTYATNPWRGELVSPMAANVQWDVFENAGGNVLVRMLYNERETDFKPACDSARYADGSHYYNFDALKTCYGR